MAAAVSQDILGDPPPYPVLSVPVLLGVLGGAGLAAGGGGLLLLRSRSDPYRTDGLMSSRTRSLLLALLLLSVTGLLTLLLRGTVAFAPVLVVHLAAVTACFAIAPYTKFVHVVFRFLALVQDRSQAGAAGREGDRAAARAGGARPVRPGPDRGPRARPRTSCAWPASRRCRPRSASDHLVQFGLYLRRFDIARDGLGEQHPQQEHDERDPRMATPTPPMMRVTPGSARWPGALRTVTADHTRAAATIAPITTSTYRKAAWENTVPRRTIVTSRHTQAPLTSTHTPSLPARARCRRAPQRAQRAVRTLSAFPSVLPSINDRNLSIIDR